ncbi:Zinc finger CCCH domain-containing protein [Actinidia chinensis var. chinensis]|uniref:Zinc finger CCCH domain-containing protein n=1 Tax=Actinidia chinensis var. chinensis TaxID=1590841 RepID=A0A2R6RE50_ACTCC|nr:Zinc finger CCCH domain-containing protein [Actinidia chinensis var. chinensis]
MVGGTQPLEKQQQQLQPQTATTAPTSAEEEALKTNTDCVYFLASPLTCKKGAECEYRHSDIARVNPRDCWFWLNGSCLNPKCGFRHPPLDGLLGTQVSTPVGSSLPPSQSAAVTSAPHNSGKQAVACIFFQKGLCLKGDRCPFLHAPNIANKVSQQPAAATVSEAPTLNKAFGGIEKCSQEQKVISVINNAKVPQSNIPKSADLLSHGKPQAEVETAPPKNGVAIDRYLPPPLDLDDQPPRYRPTNVPLATNGNPMSRSNRLQQVHVPDDHDDIMNSRDADEFSREPSPGFDVIVDDELRDSEYYQNEEHYGRSSSRERRNLNSMNDYDIGHYVDYDSMVDVDREVYCDPCGYDSYERIQGQYSREKRRASSERMLGGSSHLERRRHPRPESPDLRHHLSKQRRVNGLRSVISYAHAHDNCAKDQSYRGPSRRDAHHLPPNDSSVSNRFRGRIKLPERSSSPVNGSDLHPEREMDRGRNWGRLSPGRPQVSIHQGRLRDRIKGRVQEDISNEGRSFRGLLMRDTASESNPNFAGPKSLAELKGGKNAESKDHQMKDRQSLSLGKRKYLENHQQSESDFSFEGPKPLSEILKRKKGAQTAVPESGLSYGNKEDITHKEETKDQDNLSLHRNKEETKSAVGLPPLPHNASELETEETVEDHEPETYDHRDGESDYEHVEGEDYNLEEAENAEAEEEYLDDDDDGDDFAKKIGVMFS